jgi:hypothetical protein
MHHLERVEPLKPFEQNNKKQQTLPTSEKFNEFKKLVSLENLTS